MIEVLVLYYSRHGHVRELARVLARGVEQVPGTRARLRTIPGLREENNGEGDPEITEAELAHCAALALGSPCRFGNMAAPVKAWLETTTGLWQQGTLAGRPACVFTSSSSLHGGQESTLLSMMIPLLHHGMLVMGLPYTEADLSTTGSGGTPYGASHVAGPRNDRALSDEERRLALAQGRRLAGVALRLAGQPTPGNT